MTVLELTPAMQVGKAEALEACKLVTFEKFGRAAAKASRNRRAGQRR